MYKRQLRGDVGNILNVQLYSFSFVNMKPNLRSHQISPLCSQSSPVFLYCNCNHANCWKPATLNLKSRVRSTSFLRYIPVSEVSVLFLEGLQRISFAMKINSLSMAVLEWHNREQRDITDHKRGLRKSLLEQDGTKLFSALCASHAKSQWDTPFIFSLEIICCVSQL